MAEALTAFGGATLADEVFARAGLARYRRAPPETMVDECEVVRLHEAVEAALAPEQAERVARDAGRRTADYLLARRIPRHAQILLRALPRRRAAAVLVRAIAQHAWTFAGSGHFTYGFDAQAPRTVCLSIIGSPLCARSARAYLGATFEGVFGAVLGAGTRVALEPECGFRLMWAAKPVFRIGPITNF